jgi:hypothetical protein
MLAQTKPYEVNTLHNISKKEFPMNKTLLRNKEDFQRFIEFNNHMGEKDAPKVRCLENKSPELYPCLVVHEIRYIDNGPDEVCYHFVYLSDFDDDEVFANKEAALTAARDIYLDLSSIVLGVLHDVERGTDPDLKVEFEAIMLDCKNLSDAVRYLSNS